MRRRDPTRTGFLAAVGAGNLARVHEFLSMDPGPSQATVDRALAQACRFGQASIVNHLLRHDLVDAGRDDNALLIELCGRPEHRDGFAVMTSTSVSMARRKDAAPTVVTPLLVGGPIADVVKLIIATVDPTTSHNQALSNACRVGNTDVVRVLIADARVAGSMDSRKARSLAKANGHDDIVALFGDA